MHPSPPTTTPFIALEMSEVYLNSVKNGFASATSLSLPMKMKRSSFMLLPIAS
jgi:hypothetical protein